MQSKTFLRHLSTSSAHEPQVSTPMVAYDDQFNGSLGSSEGTGTRSTRPWRLYIADKLASSTSSTTGDSATFSSSSPRVEDMAQKVVMVSSRQREYEPTGYSSPSL